jgi:hypothetical protein
MAGLREVYFGLTVGSSRGAVFIVNAIALSLIWLRGNKHRRGSGSRKDRAAIEAGVARSSAP